MRIKAKEAPIVQGVALEKLKTIIIDFVRIDQEAQFRAKSHFTNTLYGKFLGRAPLLDVVRNVLFTPLGLTRRLSHA